MTESNRTTPNQGPCGLTTNGEAMNATSLSSPPSPSPSSPIVALYTRQGYPSLRVIDSIADYANTPVNTLIITGFNTDSLGIVYNNYPYLMFDNSGIYVGDQNWFPSLASLRQATNISNVFLSLTDTSIAMLAGLDETSLGNVMSFLGNNGITGIDLDAESIMPMDPSVQIVTLAAIKANLALTAAPFTNQAGWQAWIDFVSQSGGTVSWLNVLCYSGGSGNDPIAWAQAMSPTPIAAAVEAIPGGDAGEYSPFGVASQLAHWQAENPSYSLSGAVIWNYGIVKAGPFTVAGYAHAMLEGLL